MSFPCNALIGVCPPIVAHVIVHPFFIVPHFSPMNVGDHLPNSFLGYLFDGEEENSLTSHVEETKNFGIRVFQRKCGRQRITCW
jgi:hypothetical protein